MTNKSYKIFAVLLAAPMIALSSGVSAQMHVDDIGNVGIGTYSPSEAFEIVRIDTGARSKLTSVTSTNNEGAQVVWRRSRSNAGMPTAVQLNDNLGAFSFRGHDGAGWTSSRGFINVVATENWAPGANGTDIIFQTTENGTDVLTEVMRITGDGLVKINGTPLNVPDYVFAEDYELMSLDQLAAYINENKHLPGVASEAEIKANGLDLAGSQLSVLEKVEELTLYTLQQHENLKQMMAENVRLKEANRQVLSAYHELVTEQAELRQLVNSIIQDQSGSIELTSLK